ncbi:MAG: aminopeptidase P family protein [Clostridiales bacterium]|nr:aminopeptidase P family protein [Clostridiales bacterium]
MSSGASAAASCESGSAKTPEQLLAIMKASAMGDMCFSHVLGFMKAGMTEIEVAAEIERVLFSLGAEKLAFPVICVSGERTSLPHGEPSGKAIEKGDFVTVDFGAVVDGYCGDMTRTVAMGQVTDFQRKIYHIVLAAQFAAIDACIAGARCVDVDRAARGIIESAGYGEEFCHGTGHSVGAEVHEMPALNRESEAVLEENMAVTIEPGIYMPGKFGVRIEDLAIVTKFGIINTVKSPKELIIL